MMRIDSRINDDKITIVQEKALQIGKRFMKDFNKQETFDRKDNGDCDRDHNDI